MERGELLWKQWSPKSAPPTLFHHCQLDLKTTTELHSSVNVYCDEKLDFSWDIHRRPSKSTLKHFLPSGLGCEVWSKQPREKGGILELAHNLQMGKDGREEAVERRSLVPPRSRPRSCSWRHDQDSLTDQTTQASLNSFSIRPDFWTSTFLSALSHFVSQFNQYPHPQYLISLNI